VTLQSFTDRIGVKSLNYHNITAVHHPALLTYHETESYTCMDHSPGS